MEKVIQSLTCGQTNTPSIRGIGHDHAYKGKQKRRPDGHFAELQPHVDVFLLQAL